MNEIGLQIQKKRSVDFVPLSLMMALVCLRFPLLILASYKLIPLSADSAFNLFLDGTYLFTAILIWWERKRIADFNFGLGALIMFIMIPLVKPIFYILMAPFVPYRGASFSWLQIIVAIALGSSIVYELIKKRISFRMRLMKSIVFWLTVSILIGLIAGGSLGLLNSLQSDRSSQHASFPILVYLLVTQISNAAISEEPLFRGFIWGYLRRLKWKEHWIWLFQALLFTLGHIYYWGRSPYSLFIIVPVSSLILGYIVWRSKSIGTSMIVHGLFNSVGDIVAHFRIW